MVVLDKSLPIWIVLIAGTVVSLVLSGGGVEVVVALPSASETPDTRPSGESPRCRPEPSTDAPATAVRAEVDRGRAGSLVAVRRGGPRELLVVARDLRDRPIEGVELLLERAERGAWVQVRSRAADVHGESRYTGLREGASYRVGARFPAAPAPVEVSSSTGVVPLVLARPLPAFVQLESANGLALSGARRVEVHVTGALGSTVTALAPTNVLATWTALVDRAVDGVLHVTDSLGRTWSAPIALAPEETRVATPSPAWIAIARTEIPGSRVVSQIEPDRLRWTLQFGDRAPRRGSGRLAPNGGFHAVVPAQRARSEGGVLELRWNGAAGERVLACPWHPDPNLEHIDLPPSPLGEGITLSSRRF